MNLDRVLQRLQPYLSPPPEKLPPLSRFLYEIWRRRFTANGRMLLLTLLLSAPVSATIGINYPLYTYAILLFSLVVVGLLVAAVMKPNVEVQRTLPERCASGATVEVRAQLINRGRIWAYDMGVQEHRCHSSVHQPRRPEMLDALAPGAAAEVRYTLTPTRRGAYDFQGAVACSGFPFGLYYSMRLTRAPARMLVYPRFSPLAAVDLPVGRKHQPGGLQMVSQVGDSEEFLGNREYRPGDRLRDIHHAAWARRGVPVVREYQQEYLCRIALVVDTFAADPAAREALEAALSLSAAVADVLSRQEYVIDIFAAGADLYHFQAGRSLAYFDNILDILACIEACDSNPFQTLAPALRQELEGISTAVVMLLDWDEVRADFVRLLQDCGVAVKAVVVREGPPTLDPAGAIGPEGRVQVLTPEQARTGTERL